MIATKACRFLLMEPTDSSGSWIPSHVSPEGNMRIQEEESRKFCTSSKGRSREKRSTNLGRRNTKLSSSLSRVPPIPRGNRLVSCGEQETRTLERSSPMTDGPLMAVSMKTRMDPSPSRGGSMVFIGHWRDIWFEISRPGYRRSCLEINQMSRNLI